MTATLTAPTDLAVRRVGGWLGAEISGVRLGPDLPAGTVAAIRQLLLAHRVVWFRDQELTDAAHEGFARLLGPLTTAHPTVPAFDEAGNVMPVDAELGNRANSWHSDVTFVDRPPVFSMLRAVVVPDHGGDTAWASTVDAYASLPAPLQTLARELRAVHTNVYDYSATHGTVTLSGAGKDYRRQFESTRFVTEHPVVREHPETGEEALLLGHFVQRFVGLNSSDSAHVLRVLQDHVERPENTVRWSWRPGDVAIWDNRSTQHYAVTDYPDGTARRLHRVTTVGDVPVGPDGRASVALEGSSADYVRGAA